MTIREVRTMAYGDLPVKFRSFFETLMRKPNGERATRSVIPPDWEEAQPGIKAMLMAKVPLQIRCKGGEVSLPVSMPSDRSAFGQFHNVSFPGCIAELPLAFYDYGKKPADDIPTSTGIRNFTSTIEAFEQFFTAFCKKLIPGAMVNDRYYFYLHKDEGGLLNVYVRGVLDLYLFSSSGLRGERGLDVLFQVDQKLNIESIGLIQRVNDLLEVHPGVIWYKGGLVQESNPKYQGKFGLLWSTNPDQRVEDMVRLLKAGWFKTPERDLLGRAWGSGKTGNWFGYKDGVVIRVE